MNIVGEKVTLRAIEPDDLEDIRAWYNDPAIVPGLGAVQFPTSSQQQRMWYERIQGDERTARLAVEHRESGDLIGISGFWGIDWRDRRAEHAVLIGTDGHRGQGLGKDTIRTCVRYAFEYLDLVRLDATILADNVASARAYQACGFKDEGRLRQHALRAGKRVDRIYYGLLRGEERYDDAPA